MPICLRRSTIMMIRVLRMLKPVMITEVPKTMKRIQRKRRMLLKSPLAMLIQFVAVKPASRSGALTAVSVRLAP